MKTKRIRILLSISISICALTLSVIFFKTGLSLPLEMAEYMSFPGRYQLEKQLESGPAYEERVAIHSKLENIKEVPLNIFEITFILLTGGILISMVFLNIPIAIMLIHKIMKSEPLMSMVIQYQAPFALTKTDIALAEAQGIYSFHQINDTKLVFSKPRLKKKLIKTGIIWLIITPITLLAFPGGFGITVASFFVTLFFFLKAFLPSPQLIFDRMEGRVRLKGNITSPGFSVDFEKVYPALMHGEMLAISHPLFEYSILAYGKFNTDTWSFYVHYMDRNRPLPAGDVFDAFREKDYLRRK
ncbi:MAG: hypothetical protein JXR39_04345, partial [Marinilabiliaceae bacterium]|nr:hypothetical protein [Marinilabiliaceae bacterium]